MHIIQQTYLWIACLLFSWLYGQVTGSQTKRKTWKKAVLDCYENGSALESNETILKQYLNSHTGVNSIWVGGFEALLPWIEIRGCYRIPITCNSLERDEMNAKNSALCQLKCMKRQYFAFNQKNERCVCFDEHETIKQESVKANLCQECIQQSYCDLYAVVYKVFHVPISEAENQYDCLSYECNFESADPTFNNTTCSTYCLPYCRDGRRAADIYLQFSKYRFTCEEEHFTYPLLHSENPVKLCNISKSILPGICIWVGVYRQRLDMDNLDKAVLQNFNNIEKYILHCKSLSINGGLVRTEHCRDTLHYQCTKVTPMDLQKDIIYSSTSTPVCRLEDSGIGETDNRSSGLIAGILTSFLVIVVVVVVVVIIYRRRSMSKTPKLNDSRSKENEHRNNVCACERNSDSPYHETGVTLGPYSFAKPLSDNNLRREKAAEDENEYSRIVSAVFVAPNQAEITNNCFANPEYNDVKLNNDKTNQNLNSLTEAMGSDDYCLAKPIADPGEISPYTDNADYDHLRNVKYREENTVKVYDHVPNIIDSDVTYDHSTINIRKAESNTYDHFDTQN